MAATKTYKVILHHDGRETAFEGTLEHLVGRTFGYTLECGHSWNHKIPLEPKSIKSLIKALNASAEECRRYNEYYELAA